MRGIFGTSLMALDRISAEAEADAAWSVTSMTLASGMCFDRVLLAAFGRDLLAAGAAGDDAELGL